MKYIKITTCDFYGRADSLDGENIMKPGNYSLRFEDDIIETRPVLIHSRAEEAQVDMNNHPDHYTAHIAYIREFVHGHVINFPLRENGVLVGVE
jgi:hypothetical protein